jgi:hypothetical protein
MRTISLAVAFLMTFSARAEDLQRYFMMSAENLKAAGFVSTQKDGVQTLKRRQGQDQEILEIKPKSYVMTRMDFGRIPQKLTYSPLDSLGKVQSKTVCTSQEINRNSERRNVFDCLTVSSLTCQDFRRIIAGFFGTNPVASESKFRECAEIIKKVAGLSSNYGHLQTDQARGLTALRKRFGMSTQNIPNTPNPFPPTNTYEGISNLVQGYNICKEELNWGDPDTRIEDAAHESGIH